MPSGAPYEQLAEDFRQVAYQPIREWAEQNRVHEQAPAVLRSQGDAAADLADVTWSPVLGGNREVDYARDLDGAPTIDELWAKMEALGILRDE